MSCTHKNPHPHTHLPKPVFVSKVIRFLGPLKLGTLTIGIRSLGSGDPTLAKALGNSVWTGDSSTESTARSALNRGFGKPCQGRTKSPEIQKGVSTLY